MTSPTPTAPPFPYPDPLWAARRTTHRALAAAAGGLLLTTAWALWPLPRTTVQPLLPEMNADNELATAAGPLDLSVFDAPVWIVAAAPPPPAPLPPEALPPPPLRLQLLGIIRNQSDGAYRAALYDPDADKVFVVASGDPVAGRLVKSIEPRAVLLAQGTSVQALNLRPDQQGGGP